MATVSYVIKAHRHQVDRAIRYLPTDLRAGNLRRRSSPWRGRDTLVHYTIAYLAGVAREYDRKSEVNEESSKEVCGLG